MLTIYPLEVTPFQQQCRILVSNTDTVIVDPGGDADKILALCRAKGISPTQIWLTHSHLDHCGGVVDIQKAFPEITLLGHKEEASYRARVEEISGMYGLQGAGLKNCPEPTRYIDEGDTLSCGDVSFQILWVPGHAPGHLCFYAPSEKLLIAGDTLFAGSVGRTDLPGGNTEQLLTSITKKLLVLPDETRVCPGHGPDTTIGEEKNFNPYVGKDSSFGRHA